MLYSSKKARSLVFLIILLTAVFFRTYQLDSIPSGLYPDEAMNGNDALQALETAPPVGGFKVYYPNNNGREGLYNNLTALVFKAFGANIVTLKLVAILAGILGVIALYLLGKELFSWQIGALSSFLMAISFWHVNFSRIAFRAILAPMLATYALYFFWKGLRGKHLLNFLLAGIFIGLGFYTYIAFRVTPLFIGLGFWAYWHFIKKDFASAEYAHARRYLVRGLVLLMVTMMVTALPIGIYYWQNPGDFLGRTSQISVFSDIHALKTLGLNVVQTMGMFNFTGDHNWRHNLPGQPTLFWPIGVLFLMGFLRSLIKLFKYRKNHGHFSTIPVILLAWFFIGLLPVVLSNEGLPHALRSILVAPVVFLFAGEGAWWFFITLKHWYALRDKHPHEAMLVSTLVLIIFLFGLSLVEYHRYFVEWGQNPETASAFNQNYVKIGREINALPTSIPKYVIVERGDVFVNGIPVTAQTTMFITQTFAPEAQIKKNVIYLSSEEFDKQKTHFEQDHQARVFYLR